jgi:hypothetical protein
LVFASASALAPVHGLSRSPPGPPRRLLTRWRFCWTQNLAAATEGGVMRWGWEDSSRFLLMSSPGLTKTSAAKSRSIGKRSAAVRPGDPVLPALVAHCVSFGQSPALDPGSRDGLSVHTVRDDSLRETGKPCREASTLRGRAKICVQQICQPVNGRRPPGAETPPDRHGETFAQGSKVSVNKKEQETRATQSCTVVLCNRRSIERPVRW